MNLLIIDDDAISSFINTRVAQTSGMFCEIHTVHNGQDALEFLRSTSRKSAVNPDVILLDLNMPLINGFDFITALKNMPLENKENISIVILTSSDDSKDIERAHSLGIDHYLQKPLTINDLQATLFALGKYPRFSHASVNDPPPVNWAIVIPAKDI